MPIEKVKLINNSANQVYPEIDPADKGTKVVANPTLAGTESDLSGIQVGDTKYKVPTGTEVVANPTLAGTEADLTGIQVGTTKYKVPSGGGGGAVDSVNGKTGEVVLSKADILADMDTTAQIYCILFNTTGSKPKVNSGLYAQGSLHYKHDILTTSQLRALLKQGDIKFIIPFNSSGYGLSEIYVDKGVGKTTEDCVFYVIEEISINRIKYFKFVMPASTTVGLTRVYYYDTGELGGSSVVANPTLSGTEEYITGIKIDNIPYQITDLQPKYLTLYDLFVHDTVGIIVSPTEYGNTTLFGNYYPANGQFNEALLSFLSENFDPTSCVPRGKTVISVYAGVYPPMYVYNSVEEDLSGHPHIKLGRSDCLIYSNDNLWDSSNMSYVQQIYSYETINSNYLNNIDDQRYMYEAHNQATTMMFLNACLIELGIGDVGAMYNEATAAFLIPFTNARKLNLPLLFNAQYPSSGSGSGSGE